MEKEFLVSQTQNKNILELSSRLAENNVEGSDLYYEKEGYKCPFMKLPKKYKKESDTDPEVCYIYVDVEDNGEYTVFGNYGHEHCAGAADAALLITGMLTGYIAEVALIYGDMKAAAFMLNSGDPQANVDVIGKDAETAEFATDNLMSVRGKGYHMHLLFAKNHPLPYSMMFDSAKGYTYQGVTVYLASCVFGEHPEIYVIQ